MAVLILSPTAAKIIGRLASVAVKQIATIWGVNEDLKDLENTISIIHGVLLDAEEKQIHNRGIRNWLKRLAEAVHEADDLMDEFETEALRRQVMGGNGLSKQVFTFFSSSNQIAFRHKIGRRIRGIKKKLDVTSKDSSFLILENRSHDKESRVNWRETHSRLPQHEVIGRDEDRDEIIKLLIDSRFEKNLAFIPIVGMGGLGKTTLAQSVFNDEKVQQHFKLKAWVCVSDTFDLKVILQRITKSKENQTLEELQCKVSEQLDGKVYLIVLDDVWEEDHMKWLELENLLTGGAKGSRVLVTTRSNNVAVALKAKATETYQLKELDEEKSWSLFEKMAFGQEEKNANLVKIGREIVKRCGGIPLAIITIGSTLFSKNSESEWSSFNQEFSKIHHKEGGVLETLRLSYNNLASHLKHCFAYCSLFPKGYRIEVPTLIQLWMAQGLLHYDNNEYLEELGYTYFKDLLVRSFFQETKLNKLGVVESCKMHDLMHDLAMEVAGQEYAAVKSTTRGNSNTNARCISFHVNINSLEQVPTSLDDASKIRIMLLLDQNYWENQGNKPIKGATIAKFKKIRTLDLHEMGITIVSDCIRRLKFVRYLDLSNNANITNLPDAITNLLNLQTLKLINCSKLQQLPRDIKKLVKLRHLDIGGCFNLTHMPVGFGHLTNLTTLSNYILPKSNASSLKQSGELKELMDLNNLRGNLEISNLKYGKIAEKEFESAFINNEKQYVVSLHLKWDDITKTVAKAEADEMSQEQLGQHAKLKYLNILGYGGLTIPCWLRSLPNMVSLSLEECHNCKHLIPMSYFSNLKKLELKNLSSLEYITNSYKEDNFIFSLELLPSLNELNIENLPNLKAWWGDFEENQNQTLPYFPRLSKLNVKNCPNLTCMPLYPALDEVLIPWYWKSLQHTLMSQIASCSPLSKLKYLHLERIEDIECFPDCFKSLTSLQNLNIKHCLELKNLSPGIQHLTRLQSLHIFDCNGLASLSEAIGSLTNLESLNIRGCNGLTSLPESLGSLTSLKSLNIWRCNGLTSLPEVIRSLTNLKTLSVRGCNSLTSLPESIGSLTSLNSLHIRGYNCLTSLPEAIGSLDNLESLDITKCNGLTSLPEAIGSLTSLKSLDIQGCNGLTSLPEAVGSLTSLRSFHIQGCNGLTSLPQAIGSLTNLESLDITKCNGLTSLSETIGSLTSLKSLDIQGCNGLTSLLEAVGSLTSLRSFHIQGCNGLTSLPQAIGSLTSLESLYITQCNGLTSLSETIGSLTSLKSLNIWSCNGLTSLPESIGNLTSLKSLHIRRCNGLTSFSEAIGSLTSLESFSILGCNSLTSFPEAIGSLTSLESLDITGYCLTSLPKTVGSLTSLKSLLIWGMYCLTSLPEAIGSLTSFKSLDIMECHGLTSLPEAIGSITSLKTLSIRGCNGLTSLPNAIKSLTSLEILDIFQCPMLLKRCQTQIGEDWHKISHIPGLVLFPDPNKDNNSESEVEKKQRLFKSCMPRWQQDDDEVEKKGKLFKSCLSLSAR